MAEAVWFVSKAPKTLNPETLNSTPHTPNHPKPKLPTLNPTPETPLPSATSPGHPPLRAVPVTKGPTRGGGGTSLVQKSMWVVL